MRDDDTDAVIIYSNISNNARETNHISSFVWEDDFLDESKIDNLLSYNYELSKTCT